MYDALVNLFVSNSVGTSPPPPSGTTRRGITNFRQETGNMPWLFYEGVDYTDDPNMDLR